MLDMVLKIKLIIGLLKIVGEINGEKMATSELKNKVEKVKAFAVLQWNPLSPNGINELITDLL